MTTATISGATEIARQLAAMESGCAVYDLASRAKIRLTGPDRVRWLNGMVTNNVRDLALNHGVYCFLLNAQGRIQGDLYVYNLGDSLLVDTDEGQRENILAHFDKFIVMDDVEVADISSTLIAVGLAGPKAQDALRTAGIQTPDLAPLETCIPKCECNCNCAQCTVVRGDDPSGNAYEIWLAPDQVKPTWDALVKAGATAVGAATLEQRRIQLGIPRFGIDIRDRDLPQETGQDRALNFTKGCYLGQEIVERIRSRGNVHRMFAKFAISGGEPVSGLKILSGEREVGEITSLASFPSAGGETLALGYVRREFADKDLIAGGAIVRSRS
jgi:folate-binding protein YgfZ